MSAVDVSRRYVSPPLSHTPSDYVVMFPDIHLPDIPAPYSPPQFSSGPCLSPRSLHSLLPDILRSALSSAQTAEAQRALALLPTGWVDKCVPWAGGVGQEGDALEVVGGHHPWGERRPKQQSTSGRGMNNRVRRRRACGSGDGIAGTGGRIMSGSITYDKSQNRFMTQWKSGDGTKHSKSFYVKNFGSTEAARERAAEFRRVLLGGGTEEMLKECAGGSNRGGRRTGRDSVKC
eukprot:GHVS01071465.1.p1 GENE.GHVS01071465.1~~GHVS01071465.1.p1  ORF type:complete len:233 (+),score=49.23 GHVS01071465.1:78-776(+)